MPAFTYPLAWIAAVTLPALAGIYFLRHRYRRKEVSSLLFWQMHRESREGGTKTEKPRWPLVFFIELLILALLVLAATGPRWQTPQTRRPLIVVLDDSQSMLAGPEGQRPRELAIESLGKIARKRGFLSFRLIASGETPRLLGDEARHPKEMEAQFAQWTCLSPGANLQSAIGLARSISHGEADILVLTDQAPEDPPGKGRVRWAALGLPRINFAFVNAARTAYGGEDRLLLEIANPSASAGESRLQITTNGQTLHEETVRVEAGESYRITVPVPPAIPVLHATLSEDALPGDNTVALVPPIRRTIRVANNLPDGPLKKLVGGTLASTGMLSTQEGEPEFLVHDSENIPTGKGTWSLRLLPASEKPARFTGPFVTDTSHPATKGLSLTGAIWGGDPAAQVKVDDLPVITAGNIPLLTHFNGMDGRNHLTLQYIPEHSTLHLTPQWPALFWNLLRWRAQAQPGLKESNHRLGMDIPYRAAGSEIILRRPDGSAQKLQAPGKDIRLPIDSPGVYQVTSGFAFEETTETFAVNFLAGQESDLSKATAGEWGSWDTETDVRIEYANFLPYLVLAALAAMAWHLFCISRQKGRV